MDPNPLGAESVPAIGEEEAVRRISYEIPDVLDGERDRYAGRRVAVVGSGHSAKHVIRELSLLAEEAPETTVTWIVRRGEDEWMGTSDSAWSVGVEQSCSRGLPRCRTALTWAVDGAPGAVIVYITMTDSSAAGS